MKMRELTEIEKKQVIRNLANQEKEKEGLLYMKDDKEKLINKGLRLQFEAKKKQSRMDLREINKEIHTINMIRQSMLKQLREGVEIKDEKKEESK